MLLSRRIQLSDADDGRRIRILGDSVSVDAGQKTSMVTIIRMGDFYHPQYGDFAVTRELLEGIVRNFNTKTYGQKIFLDRAHKPEEGAAAEIRKLFIDGNKLRAQVDWTPFGIELVEQKGYRYLSADYIENYTDNESRQTHGPLLFGAGLVTRPHIKHLDEIQLAECTDVDGDLPISGRLLRILNEDIAMKWADLIRKLQEKLMKLALPEGVADTMIKLAEASVKSLTELPSVEAALLQIEATAKQLAEAAPSNAEVNLQLQGLDEDAVRRILAEDRQTAATETKQLAEALAARRKKLTETIDAAKGLEDADRVELKESLTDLITPEMSDDQVVRLAELQIGNQSKLIAARRLADAGVGISSPMGTVRLSDTPTETAATLEKLQREMLGRTAAARNGGLILSETVDPFVQDVLAVFDTKNAAQIHSAVRTLNDGTTNMASTDLPVGFQREVIREALSDLNVLQLVATYTDPSAQATTQIPYEERDVAGIRNSAVTPERSPIQKASIRQKMDLAYVTAMKIAIDVSNEVMHFTRASGINWDAWGRNIQSASRLIREILCQRLANEMQRISDSFMSMDVSGENIAAQLDGSNATIKTVEFPLVAEHQQQDLQGNSVGSKSNPIVINFNGTVIDPYDGSDDLTSGTYYYVSNYNLGYITFVDETGSPVMPSEATATLSYSYASNIAKVDADVPNGVAVDVHLNKLLRAIGSSKAMMNADRFVTPDFLLMSPILNDVCTNAEMFKAEAKRAGSDTNGQGDLERVKGLSAYGTNAPGIHLGDERILMGVSNVLSYTVAKPWEMSEPIQARNATGQLIGAKESYGEEYNAIKAPKPLQNRFTSVLYYSATNR